MYDDVLVPTDGLEGMDRVTDHACRLAEHCDATIHALYVVDDTAYGSVPDDARESVRETLEADGRDATRAVTEAAYEHGLDAHSEVRWGDPTVAIIAYAVEHGIDLIVMGTRGRTGFERFLLGSVAEKVVRVSPVPVTTVNVGDPEELTAEIEALLGHNT